MKKRILLCTQWVDRYRPLVRSLLDSRQYEILAEEQFVKKFGSNEPDLRSYHALIPPAEIPKLESETNRRLQPFVDALLDESASKISNATDYTCLSQKTLIARQLRESFMQTIYMLDVFEQITSLISIDLLITDGPGIRQQAWVAAAKRCGVPSLEIYHGMIHVKPELVPPRMIQADYMAMGSGLIQQVYQELGIPPERLCVTGLPSEPITDLDQNQARQILAAKYNIDPHKKIALLYTAYDSGDTFEFLHDMTTGYQIDTLRQTITSVREFNEKHDNSLQLIVKRHPTLASAGWDDERAYHYYADQIGQKIYTVDPYESNPVLLNAADVVLVVKFSTTISEAINADLPVILFPISRDWLHEDLLDSGALIPVDDQKGLNDKLKRCLLDQDFITEIAGNRSRFKKKYPHVEFSQSNDNIMRFITDILEKDKSATIENRRHLSRTTSKPPREIAAVI
jgi:hypothetical protein